VVAGKQSEVGDRFEELKVVGVPFKNRGKRSKPDVHHVLLLGTGSMCQAGTFVIKLADVREGRNYGTWFIYQVGTLFLAINNFQKSDNPLPGVSCKYVLQ
jgi:hypothetical protein